MYTSLKVIWEGMNQAFQQLVSNKLRSFLSILGISIGIFCIIGVLAAVESLESNVRGSLSKLGSNVVYVQKFSWGEDPGRNFFKYMRRPNISYSDYKEVKENLTNVDLVGFYVGIGSRTVKHQSSSVDRAFLLAASEEVAELFNLEFEYGRYFSPSECVRGSSKIILGYEVANGLFGEINPVGKKVKMDGRHLEVIGVIKKSGKSIINIANFDQGMFINYELARKVVNLKTARSFDRTVGVKGAPGISTDWIKDEVTGILRGHRRLKPKEEDDFSLNEISILSELLDDFFSVLNLLGIVIGIFAMIVGVVSVANIMFVSVKERTNIIGVKKALGAKRFFILLEFLIESIILCIVGGIMGLVLVFIVVNILTQVIDFEFFLSLWNIFSGIGVSIIVGIVAGMIPALQASGMDPVEAIRK